MTYRPKDTKERITHRLKISQGHLKKILEMVDNDVYCIDILHQTDALQKALKEIDNVILENHLKCCVSDSIREGKSEEAIQEVMNVFKKKK
jgi:DNA-binding FrmR family transcriptional regulator